MYCFKNLICKLIEPKEAIAPEKQKFSNHYLYHLIFPIIIEQMLTLLIGMCDTLMVSYVGEAAVSGVSLVNQVNNIFIFIFSSIAAGGAVVASQYIGRGDRKLGLCATGQLMMITIGIAISCMLLAIIFHHSILSFLFGKVDPDVMAASTTYLVLSAVSFPMLAMYNSACAIFRSMSKTKAIMNTSLIMNAVNITGNYIGVFILHAGIAGVAVPSIISRTLAAIIMFILLLNQNNTLYISKTTVFLWDFPMIQRILHIAIPNGIENGLFQASKIAVSSVVALFGTVQIAANGVAQSFWAVTALFPLAMGNAFVTVIGQCMGAGEIDAADYYNKKLLRITYVGSFLWHVFFLALTPFVLNLYSLNTETRDLVIYLIIFHSIFNTLLAPIAFPLSSGLRAAGDVHFTMFAAIFSSAVCRVVFAVVLGILLKLGVAGTLYAMCLDWLVKAILIWTRYKSRKWTKMKVI